MRVGSCQRGFTYIALLAAMAILALSLNGVMGYVSMQAQREREADLMRIGDAFAKALGSYYNASPGSRKMFPRALSELTNDPRSATIKRHLREIYDDPITRSGGWGLVLTPEGTISGVYSMSDRVPIRGTPVELDSVRLASATKYSEWRFVFDPQSDGTPARR